MANEEPGPRRLIKFGNSSYIVSLPKGWIEKHKLKKGDLVYIGENNDNELMITAGKPKSNEKIDSITIDIEEKNYNDIKKIFTSAYISNNEIILTGKNARPISEIAHRLLQEKSGLEIIEESESRILIKDIFDYETVSLEKIIRRVDNIIRSMFEDIIAGLGSETFKEWTLKEIYRADTEVNKNFFLIIKIMRKCQDNSSFMRFLKINSKKLLDIPWFAMEIEHVGDEIKRIAKILNIAQFDVAERKNFLELLQLLEKDYTDTMTSYYTGNKEIALDMWKRKEKYVHQCEALSEKSKNPRIWSISDKFKAIISHTNNISKIIYL